jgi:hypothetical protein
MIEETNMSRDLTHKVERLELFEEKLEVILQGISVFAEDQNLSIYGELLSAKGTGIISNIRIYFAVYDKLDRVVNHDYKIICEERFLGLETFVVILRNVDIDNISKIRIYCQRM